MKKLIVIIGPTASKKTTIAHEIAKKINGSIINGDAFQIYKELNAGVNKPSKMQLNEIDYYLLNILNLNENYNIKQFQIDFDNAYNTIISKNKIPILCGGSHLYIDAIVRGYDLTFDLQNHINIVSKWDKKYLYDYVKQYDEISYYKNINNDYRMMRCAAYLLANKNIPKSILELEKNHSKYTSLIIMISSNRDYLYKKINNRFDDFFNHNNWIEEVESFISKYGRDLEFFQGMKAIGYLDIYYSLINNSRLDLEKIKQKTRRLAKHQLSWCNNKFNNKIIFDPNIDNIADLIKLINEFYEY